MLFSQSRPSWFPLFTVFKLTIFWLQLHMNLQTLMPAIKCNSLNVKLRNICKITCDFSLTLFQIVVQYVFVQRKGDTERRGKLYCKSTDSRRLHVHLFVYFRAFCLNYVQSLWVWAFFFCLPNEAVSTSWLQLDGQ